MTKPVTRYTQPCIQTQPGLEFKVAEVPLFEDPKGKWVKYEDIKHLLQSDEPSEPLCVTCGTHHRSPWEPCPKCSEVHHGQYVRIRCEIVRASRM